MIDFFIGLSLGLVIGWRVCEWFMTTAFTSLMQKLDIKDQQLEAIHSEITGQPAVKVGRTRIQIRLECHADTLYAFRADTEQFLGQGRDQDELFQVIQKRFPTENFVVQGADAELLQKSHG